MTKKVEEQVFIVPELEIRVSMPWIRMVRWCQTDFPDGDIKVRIVNAQPTEVLETPKPKIRFDKEPRRDAVLSGVNFSTDSI